jgi:uncharacterized protein YqeY
VTVYQEKITADIKTAMKAGDKARLQVLRMLLNDLKQKQLAAQVDSLPDAEELAVLQKAVKTRSDSVAQATAAGRADIAAQEQQEIELIKSYLPRMLEGAELQDAVQALAQEIGFQGAKDTGRFMKEWQARYKGRADGRAVQEALKALG